MVAFGAIIGHNTRNPTGLDPEDLVASGPLQGYYLGQLLIGSLGVLVVSGEYSSGMIRATLGAVPRRLPVLLAKLIVFLLVVGTAMVAASIVGVPRRPGVPVGLPAHLLALRPGRAPRRGRDRRLPDPHRPARRRPRLDRPQHPRRAGRPLRRHPRPAGAPPAVQRLVGGARKGMAPDRGGRQLLHESAGAGCARAVAGPGGDGRLGGRWPTWSPPSCCAAATPSTAAGPGLVTAPRCQVSAPTATSA